MQGLSDRQESHVTGLARWQWTCTERVVRTIKFCFKKIALEKGLDYAWDEQLWPLVLIYNAARQESTGVAPFTLLFAQEVVVPPDLKHAPNLDFDLEVKEDKDHRV
ncbi:hypothetical protein CYMTET_4420 [Cymbomonas tetramitiformis]|uniref:Uncharacterized protein n=1 Tax=Cymbomonas tetramitiformis TaxID=36881 RepID=A0AAE0H189_9CHLO|nr:hypothetical protein CYMTET_4420 [Cymbomonas tetramitiformis]